MKKLYTYQYAERYQKTLTRLERAIQSGKFILYTQQKKQQLWNRLSRYAKQLGITIKTSIISACIAAGLCITTVGKTQTFVQQTGTANPLNRYVADASDSSEGDPVPTFVDIDGDGDQDAFVVNYGGDVWFYKNTGTATQPVFTLDNGPDNPLNFLKFNPSMVDYGSYSLSFVDIDGDGDFDVFAGQFESYIGSIFYYKNTGTKTNPVFTQQTGSANPFNGVVIGNGYFTTSAFGDIDGDGDIDAIFGEGNGTITYYENTGTKTSPVFTLQSGTSNPFNGIEVDYLSTPALVDIDRDGDLDLFIGDYYGDITYYKNTGTKTSPVFTLETGTNNPLSQANNGKYASPAFVDIDGDGDQDVFIGNYYSGINYYENTSVTVPVKLINFTGYRSDGINNIQWKTAGEVNTKDFELERSFDGNDYTIINTIEAKGSGSNTYTAQDNIKYSNMAFYRLKMNDLDGRFTYSSVIAINNGVLSKTIIYPNPAINIIYLNITNTEILNTYGSIYDMNGKLLQNVFINSNHQGISIQSLASGMYTIKFSDGSKQTFVKE